MTTQKLDPKVGVIAVAGLSDPVIYRLFERLNDQRKGSAVFHIRTGRYRVKKANELGRCAPLPLTPSLMEAIKADAAKRGLIVEDGE